MRPGIKNSIAWSLLPQIILVKWMGSYTYWIEQHYSLEIYAHISAFFRALFGWLPFSLGDVAYIGLFFTTLYLLVVKRKKFFTAPRAAITNFFMVLAIAYGTFHLLWGMNYYRVPLSENLGINPGYSDRELLDLTNRLIAKSNTLQMEITGDTIKAVTIPYKRSAVFDKVEASYGRLKMDYPEFTYRNPALKTSLISLVLTYMGYSGYLNPFTNEAQVNRLIPKFRLPVVSAHEIAHQLGYSAENEANFIGYLAMLNSGDPYFEYSATAYALGYCLNEIKRRGDPLYEELAASVNHGVMANYMELKEFWDTYKNPAEPVFKSVFSTFLKANNQRDGIASYNRVVSLLVGYHKKNPLLPRI